MADVAGQAVGSVHAGLHATQDIINHGEYFLYRHNFRFFGAHRAPMYVIDKKIYSRLYRQAPYSLCGMLMVPLPTVALVAIAVHVAPAT